jgi:hypothetical protein
MMEASEFETFTSRPYVPAPPPPAVSYDEELRLIQSKKPEVIDLKRGYFVGKQPIPGNILSIMESFCAANNIPIYKMSQVVEYMDKVVVVERKRLFSKINNTKKLLWYWQGLRANDASESVVYGSRQYDGMGRMYVYFSPPLPDYSYKLPIPRYVMERLQKIISHFENPPSVENREKQIIPVKVDVSVSHYAAAEPDPFMRVTICGKDFVIAVWDEPSY